MTHESVGDAAAASATAACCIVAGSAPRRAPLAFASAVGLALDARSTSIPGVIIFHATRGAHVPRSLPVAAMRDTTKGPPSRFKNLDPRHIHSRPKKSNGPEIAKRSLFRILIVQSQSQRRRPQCQRRQRRHNNGSVHQRSRNYPALPKPARHPPWRPRSSRASSHRHGTTVLARK